MLVRPLYLLERKVFAPHARSTSDTLVTTHTPNSKPHEAVLYPFPSKPGVFPFFALC